MNLKTMNRLRIMKGLPPVKPRVVETAAEKQEKEDLANLKRNMTRPFFFPGELKEVSWKPLLLDPDEFPLRKHLMTRYSSKLLKEGAKYYGRLSLNDLEKKSDS